MVQILKSLQTYKHAMPIMRTFSTSYSYVLRNERPQVVTAESVLQT